MLRGYGDGNTTRTRQMLKVERRSISDQANARADQVNRLINSAYLARRESNRALADNALIRTYRAGLLRNVYETLQGS